LGTYPRASGDVDGLGLPWVGDLALLMEVADSKVRRGSQETKVVAALLGVH